MSISKPPVDPSAFTAHSYARVGQAGPFKVNPDQEDDTFSGGSPTVQVPVFVHFPILLWMVDGWRDGAEIRLSLMPKLQTMGTVEAASAASMMASRLHSRARAKTCRGDIGMREWSQAV